MRRMYSKPQLLEAVEQESKLNGIKVFEDIVDKDGHKRFLEGDIELETITGVSKLYGKWSLSGSHLLIVVAFSVADGTTLSNNTTLAKINIPEWIDEKIVGLWGSIFVDNKTFYLWADNWTSQTMMINIQKGTPLNIRFGQGLTLSAARNCRVAFDLLIDNE